MATLLWDKEFTVINLEMIKGIKLPSQNRNLRYDEKLVVPIISNTCFEEDLQESLEKVILPA